MAGIAILLDLWRKNQNLSSGLHSSHAFQSSSAFFSASAATAAAASFAAGTGFASRALFGSSVAYCDAGAALPEDYISNIQSSFERNYKYDALRYSTKQYNVELKPLFSAFELRAFTLTSLRSFLMFYLPLLEPRAEMEDDEDFLEDDQEHHVDLVVPFRKSVKHIMRETTVVTTRRILERIAVHYVSQRMAWKLLKDIPRSATRKAGRSMPTLVYVYCVSRTTFRGHMLGVAASWLVQVGIDLYRFFSSAFQGQHEDNDVDQTSEANSEDRNEDSAQEGENGEFEDDGYSGADGNRLEEDGLTSDAGYEIALSSENARNNHVVEEAGSSGSSSDSQRLTKTVSPSVSSKKFGSLSALDARPGSISKIMGDELEEGEIVVSGDSHMDHQQSGSWIHDRDEGEDEQVLQKPKIKRKRSLRVRPRHAMERPEDKSGSEMISLQRGESSVLADYKYQIQKRIDPESKSFGDSNASKHDKNEASLKNKQKLPSRKITNSSKLHGSPKSNRLNCTSAPSEDGNEHPTESWEGKHLNPNGSAAHGTKTTEIIQRGCKNVISKLQRRIDKEGHQIVPLLTDLWKRMENSGHAGGSGNNLLDLRKIDQRIDRMDYSGVMELVFDVQFMLRGAMHFYGYSYEVRTEGRKVHDLFFDILKIAFPDTDFGEARGALSFSSQAPAGTAASPRQGTVGPSKRHRMTNDAETDPCPSQKLSQSGSTSNGENARFKGHLPQKNSRTGSSSAREQPQQDNPPLLAHPGQLVVCKKKRNDRDKSLGKGRTGSTGPISPPSAIRSPGSGSTPKDARLAQQGRGSQPSQHSNGSGGSVGWANPVKRLRTDSGKRRPSHM